MAWKLPAGIAVAGVLLWLFTGRPPRAGGLDPGGAPELGRGTDDETEKFVDLPGGPWCYEVSGTGEEHLVVLLGGLGAPAEVPSVLRPLAAELRIWAVAHPPMGSVDAVVDDLLTFMDTEDISTAHLFGASVGGAIVQQVVRRAPGRVETIILSNSAAPLGRNLLGRIWAVLRRPLARIPSRTIESWTERRLAEVLGGEGDDRRDPSASTAGPTAAHVFALVDLIVDYHRREFTVDDLEGWDGRVLIIESLDDPMIPRKHRSRLRELYPEARVHTFPTGGHTPSLRHPEEFRRAVSSFLEDRRG